MDLNTLDVITDQLQQQKSHTSARADKLRSELAVIESDLTRIDAAIAALNRTSVRDVDGKPKAKGADKRRYQGPAASRAQVVELIVATLSQSGMVQATELKKTVEHQVVQAGLTRMGYSLRFKEALADSRFVHSDQGIRLQDAPSPPSRKQSADLVNAEKELHT